MGTKYQKINEEITVILDRHITREKKHAFIAYEIVEKYTSFLGCSCDKINIHLLDVHLNSRQKLTPELQKEIVSPLIKLDDGFWYFGVSVEYGNRESKPLGNYVWGNEFISLGIKIINDNEYQLKLSNKFIQTISTQEDLNNFFEHLYAGIVDRITQMFTEKVKTKIGF